MIRQTYRSLCIGALLLLGCNESAGPVTPQAGIESSTIAPSRNIAEEEAQPTRSGTVAAPVTGIGSKQGTGANGAAEAQSPNMPSSTESREERKEQDDETRRGIDPAQERRSEEARRDQSIEPEPDPSSQSREEELSPEEQPEAQDEPPVDGEPLEEPQANSEESSETEQSPIEESNTEDEADLETGEVATTAKGTLEEEASDVFLWPEQKLPTRPRKRMNIDQLDNAIAMVTGGVRWKDDPGDEEGLFEELSLSLGKPDYLLQTAEDLEPSALFQKFLGDASRKVCFELLESEEGKPPSQRVFLKYVDGGETVKDYPQDIEANLRYLLKRFHSQDVPKGAPSLNPWLWLFESASHVSSDTMVAWRTVCVALIQHPDFYSY